MAEYTTSVGRITLGDDDDDDDDTRARASDPDEPNDGDDRSMDYGVDELPGGNLAGGGSDDSSLGSDFTADQEASRRVGGSGDPNAPDDDHDPGGSSDYYDDQEASRRVGGSGDPTDAPDEGSDPGDPDPEPEPEPDGEQVGPRTWVEVETGTSDDGGSDPDSGASGEPDTGGTGDADISDGWTVTTTAGDTYESDQEASRRVGGSGDPDAGGDRGEPDYGVDTLPGGDLAGGGGAASRFAENVVSSTQGNRDRIAELENRLTSISDQSSPDGIDGQTALLAGAAIAAVGLAGVIANE